MGAVVLRERSTGFVDRGYPVSEATLYIYCDVCGSFNIKTYISFIIPVIFIAVITAAYFLASYDKRSLLCLIPIGLFAFFLPLRDIMLRYKCRKCGNVQITLFNSLHYQSYDFSIIDVPDKLTQKRYMDTDVPEFHQFI